MFLFILFLIIFWIISNEHELLFIITIVENYHFYEITWQDYQDSGFALRIKNVNELSDDRSKERVIFKVQICFKN